MKPIRDEAIEEFENTALEGCKQIRAFFTYQGTDSKYLQKAKVGAAAITGYGRLRQSETGRMAVEIAMDKRRELRD